MNVKQFVKQNRNDWKQLEQYIHKMQRNKKHVSANDIDEFQLLYQKSAQNLSYSQTFYPEADVTNYLNGLVSKAHNLLYKDQISSWKQLRDFFTTKFIKLLTEQWHMVLIAMFLFTLGGIGGYVVVASDSLLLYSLLPPEIAQGVRPDQLGAGHDHIDSALMSTEILTNNIQVAFLAFAGGITFGLLTAYVLVYNGILVGALAGLFWHYNMTYEFWAYIVPHGVIELIAIFIAGGAGLLMGYKLLVPGGHSRMYQLKEQAKRSVQLLLGTIPLFIIAGIIEGYITPGNFSLEVKYLVAFLTLAGLIAYVVIGNVLVRKRESQAKSVYEQL
ncbi:stage II sporulation protein M [Alkalihalobacillus pseudalcaliphilus]|uniref:stage II sporulation protein M n=1 Tax=Alkalihalobacillus pseudalcaliphilus TaxID=79884 RepID=UPI00064DAF40|nr:stage II sporulation protein M [Alkalihalobacillus pseudalcaliphilus]KMK75066.1 membrane protein [Alkalihalobacillus pseudalcaliphilus]